MQKLIKHMVSLSDETIFEILEYRAETIVYPATVPLLKCYQFLASARDTFKQVQLTGVNDEQVKSCIAYGLLSEPRKVRTKTKVVQSLRSLHLASNQHMDAVSPPKPKFKHAINIDNDFIKDLMYAGALDQVPEFGRMLTKVVYNVNAGMNFDEVYDAIENKVYAENLRQWDHTKHGVSSAFAELFVDYLNGNIKADGQFDIYLNSHRGMVLHNYGLTTTNSIKKKDILSETPVCVGPTDNEYAIDAASIPENKVKQELLNTLLAKVPTACHDWSYEDREAWLGAARLVFGLVFDNR